MAQSKLNFRDLLAKAEKYCAYQERCHMEVRTKLFEWGLGYSEADQVMVQLIQHNFLNEERFAKVFAGGKFRIKKWGKIKIEIELKKRSISEYCIKQAIKEIEDKEYLRTLEEVLNKRWNSEKGDSEFAKKNKVAKYLIGRGFENDLVWSKLENKK